MTASVINYIVLQAKRFAVLVPGLVIAYLAIRDIFPHLDRRLPGALAIFITYILAAYIIIPAAMRLLRIVFPSRHLPLYCVTPDGFASDPLNIGIIATRPQLIKAMQEAGWHVADEHSIRNTLAEGFSYLLNRPYPNAPVSSLYLLGRKQDIAFEIPLKTGRGNRHHVRFWATSFDPDKTPIDSRAIHWHRSLHSFPDDEQVLWLGAASLDVGITAIKHNFQITHLIHPNTNQERDLILQQLDRAGLTYDRHKVQLTDKPYRLVNRGWRGYLESDGTMIVVKL